MIVPAHSDGNTADPYSARVEVDENGCEWVEVAGIGVDELLSHALPNLVNGWAPVLIGRCDPHRPHLPPHKTAWYSGYHGHGARTADHAELVHLIDGIGQRLASGRERGLLGYGVRTPVGVAAPDVDNYGGKRGALTLAEHEDRFGLLPPTYTVTARDPATGSGIRLYRTPDDWCGPGKLHAADGSEGHVDMIYPHLRYLAAPSTLHHTGAPYRLYSPDGNEIASGVLPATRRLACDA